MIGLIKLLGGRKGYKDEQTEAGTLKLMMDDETLVEINPKLWELRENSKVMRSLSTLVLPLEQEGIDGFEVRSNGRIEASLNETEAEYFHAAPHDNSIVAEDTQVLVYTIVALTIKPGNKWRLRIGASTIDAGIDDQEFLKEIASRKEIFASGDMLRCEMRIRQVVDDEGGIRTTYTVQRIIEHIRKNETGQMFAEKAPESRP